MSSTTDAQERTAHLLGLMRQGDDAFNARDVAAMDAVHHPDMVAYVTGTFTGEMVLPDGTVIPPTGKAFDVEFGQTVKWDGDQVVAISAFWDAAAQAEQIGLA
jgi:ketosteroid isomerase-like protein